MESKIFQDGFEFHAYMEKVLDGFKREQIEQSLTRLDFFHTVNGFPEWLEDELNRFNHQVRSMASPKKPLKTTNTFKIQAGYPHEVEKEDKKRLKTYGVNLDKNIKKTKRPFSKLDVQHFTLISKPENLISFSTPKEGRYIRDIVLVDSDSDKELHIFYIISRKARLISTWSIKKDGDQPLKPKLPQSEKQKYRQP